MQREGQGYALPDLSQPVHWRDKSKANLQGSTTRRSSAPGRNRPRHEHGRHCRSDSDRRI